MNRIFRTLVMVGGLVGVLGAGSASAQVTSPVTFKTWFPFTINHKTMPAGSYELRPVDQSPSVLELTSVHGRLGMFFEVENVEERANQPAPRSEIVFLRFGDQYLMKDIWVEGEATGAETPGKIDERHVAANMGAPTEVRVAAVFLRHGSRAQS
jgi:hypothetical protein